MAVLIEGALLPREEHFRQLNPTEIGNLVLMKYMTLTWTALVVVILIYRYTLYSFRYVRQLANLNHGTTSDTRQLHFAIPNDTWAKFKRTLISAPLFRKRHNREIKLSTAMNVGTIPGRLQSIFLIGYLVMNVALVLVGIDWTQPNTNMYGLGRYRTGILSLFNMLPLALLAGRNNPLIWLLGISFDTYNLLHRWIGRMAIAHGVAHTGFWAAGIVSTLGPQPGWASMRQLLVPGNQLIFSGTVALAAFLGLLLHSPSVVRHAFYETFLHIHIVLAAIAIATVYIHLNDHSQQVFMFIPIGCWIVERLTRLWTIIRRNTGGKGVTKAEIEALPGDAVRVTLRVARPWRFTPGQHVYLCIPSVGLWTAHPFSIAWSEEESTYGEKGLPLARQDVLTRRKSVSMSLVIRRRTGFTDKLFQKAAKAPAGKFVATALIEGPYGYQSFQSYGTVMLFAAGVGITHQVPHVRDLVAGYANGTSATRKVILVWIIQLPEHLEWIRPWITSILGMEKRREILKILLFVTRPRSTKEIQSPSASVQMFPGKPDVGALIQKEQQTQIGAMSICVCGTGALSDDVRKATLSRCEATEIDFFEEAFSW